MFLIGLTGGIGSGKSTVATYWAELGGFEIDADVLAREVVSSGSAGAKAIAEQFGGDFFDGEGNLNRKKLAQHVFTQPDDKEKLEKVIHPLVRKLALERISLAPEDSIVIYTVPLLVEANVDLPFDAVVTVEAPEEIRVHRLVSSRGYTEKEAWQRISSQARPVDRANRADYILNSNQALDKMLADADNLWRIFTEQARKK
ncbi:MAG: dephospho-CoA kinase [Rhodoluna sp.]